MDKSILSTINETQIIETEDGDWEPDVRKNLMEDLNVATPVKEPNNAESMLPPGHDHMKVFLRVRPFSAEEEENNENQVGLINLRLTLRFSHFKPAN